MGVALLLLGGCVNKTVCYDKQVADTTENPCLYGVDWHEVDVAFLDRTSADTDECPNLLGLTNYGNYEVIYEFVSYADVPLKLPCEIKIRKHDSGTVVEEKIGDSFEVNIPPRDTARIKKNIYIPNCFNEAALECKNVNELPECRPITIYRTERVCE